MTVQVIAGIYWQALRLKWKGVRFYSHPGSDATIAGSRPQAIDSRRVELTGQVGSGLVTK